MKIEWEGKTYQYDAERDLTVGRLRQIKVWYPDLGAYLKFVSACAYGEPDAYACLVWILKKTAGEDCPEPMQMDFSVAGFRKALDAAAEAEVTKGTDAVDPTDGLTGPSLVPTTPEPEGSTPTPTSSEVTTSD